MVSRAVPSWGSERQDPGIRLGGQVANRSRGVGAGETSGLSPSQLLMRSPLYWTPWAMALVSQSSLSSVSAAPLPTFRCRPASRFWVSFKRCVSLTTRRNHHMVRLRCWNV
jgi:hypothetical protein